MKRTLSICIILIFSFSTTNTKAYFKSEEVSFKNHYSLLEEQELQAVSSFASASERTHQKKPVKNKFNLHLLGKGQGLEVQKFEMKISTQTSIIDKILAYSLEKVQLENFLERHQVKNPHYYADIISKKCETWEEKKLYASILIPESRGDRKAVSCKGAQGPWQVMPSWKRVLKVKGSLHDPVVNLETAQKVLNIHKEEAKGQLWGHKGGLYRYSGGSSWYPKEIARLMNEFDSFKLSGL